jgi:hypothetical protein
VVASDSKVKSKVKYLSDGGKGYQNGGGETIKRKDET